ncbi:hypothetical protein SAMN05877753_101188 [Bacillus oleivorans]|uniref:Uncharacterized protein n=1 Tax=Bacillus oleivorans TaxID=1448271 RepID=A0A285CHR4_9BACI|nr:hypothetical protein [Bacillus oleivorans]SNX66875.1 hypothetical protein SAMN05877753_101188 [Bacillus oleivorans]
MRKNRIIVLLAFVILALAVVTPALGASFSNRIIDEEFVVQINGVDVKGEGNHLTPNMLFVDAIAYAELLGKEYSFDKTKMTFTINGAALDAKIYKNRPAVHVRAIAKATGAENVDWDQTVEPWVCYVLDLPDGTIGLEGNDVYAPGVPGMGQHWANPADLPTGPIFGVEDGKLIFIEQMISKEFFVNGETIVDIPGMKGVPSPPIVHTDIELVPNGHPGFEIPHYDIHHYFVTHEEHLQFSMPPDGTTPGHGH